MTDDEYAQRFSYSNSQYWEMVKTAEFRPFDEPSDLLQFKRDLYKFASAFLDDLFSLTDLMEAKINFILEQASSQPGGISEKDKKEIQTYFQLLKRKVDTRQN